MTDSAVPGSRPIRRYLDGRWGQVHATHANPGAAGVPLVCLHATAYSAASLLPLVEALARRGKQVIALDTPGYGGSDAPPAPASIEDHAASLATTLAALDLGPVDLFGYHTGAAIGAQLGVAAPGAVRSLAMIGVPLFIGPDREAWRERLVVRHRLKDELSQFDERWRYLVADRAAGLSLERGFANFVDELRAWPRGWWAHHALFDHDLAACLAQVCQPVLILNPASALAAASREAAALIPNALLIEAPDLSGAIFERHADFVADYLLRFTEFLPR